MRPYTIRVTGSVEYVVSDTLSMPKCNTPDKSERMRINLSRNWLLSELKMKVLCDRTPLALLTGFLNRNVGVKSSFDSEARWI